MEYLKKIVGLTGLNPQAGVLLVDNLPGININTISDASIDETGLENLFDKCLENTHQKLSYKIREKLLEDVEFMDVLATSIDRNDDITESTIASSPKYKGQSIYVSKAKECVLNISSIAFTSKTAQSGVLIKIFDLKNGGIVHSQTANVTIGYNEVIIDKMISLGSNANVFVCVDCEDISLVTCPESSFAYQENCPEIVKLTVTNGEIDNTATSVGGVWGSQIVTYVHWTIECDFDKIVEKNAKLFDVAIQNLVGHFLLMESLSSDEFNLWTNSNFMVREENAKMYNYKADSLIKHSINSLLRKLTGSMFLKKSDIEDVSGYHTDSVI